MKHSNQKQHPAFTLIEVMISFALSVFIMTMIMQSYNNLTSALNKVRDQVRIVNKASLLMHQMEKDLSSLFIPFPHKTIEPEKKDASNRDNAPEEPAKKESEKDENKNDKKKKKEEAERRNRALIFSPYEDEDVKINGERWKLFKEFTGISSQPLVVYGEKHVRLVRIMYSLEVDKQNSSRDAKSYILVRKQTTDIDNYEMKPPQEGPMQIESKTTSEIKENIIADGIKEMFIKITTEKKEKESENKIKKDRKKEVEFISLFAWGNENEYAGVVPMLFTARISFWNNAQTRDISFEKAIRVYSYPTQEPAPPDAKKAESSDDTSKEGEAGKKDGEDAGLGNEQDQKRPQNDAALQQTEGSDNAQS